MAGKRDGSWLVQLEGYPELDTDQLTLDELEVAERACATPYTLMDPHVSVRIAKALLAMVLLRHNLDRGLPQAEAEDAALKATGKLTTAKLHGAFTYLPAQVKRALAPATGGEPADPPVSAATSVGG